jgi:plastocyanin
MKHLLLIALLFLLLETQLIAQSQLHTVSVSGMQFTPSTIQAASGDQIHIILPPTYSFTQVSKSVWINNQNIPLSGGIQFLPGSGGGIFTFSGMDTLYFVSSPHAAIGVKGKIVVTSLSGLRDPLTSKISDINLFPNPGKETATLSFYLPKPGIVEVNMFNAIGKKTKTLTLNKNLTEGEHSLQLDLGGLPQGMYFVEITFSNHKFVKRLYVVND